MQAKGPLHQGSGVGTPTILGGEEEYRPCHGEDLRNSGSSVLVSGSMFGAKDHCNRSPHTWGPKAAEMYSLSSGGWLPGFRRLPALLGVPRLSVASI